MVPQRRCAEPAAATPYGNQKPLGQARAGAATCAISFVFADGRNPVSRVELVHVEKKACGVKDAAGLETVEAFENLGVGAELPLHRRVTVRDRG